MEKKLAEIQVFVKGESIENRISNQPNLLNRRIKQNKTTTKNCLKFIKCEIQLFINDELDRNKQFPFL